MKSLVALALLFAATPALAESTGAINSRYQVSQTLAQNYGVEGAELQARLESGDDVQLNGATTAWSVFGHAAGRRVRARTVCKRVLFHYNKYDRAYRNECRVVGFSFN